MRAQDLKLWSRDSFIDMPGLDHGAWFLSLPVCCQMDTDGIPLIALGGAGIGNAVDK